MLFPRMLALSEVVWSPVKSTNYGDFLIRLPYHLGRLEKQDVHYRIPEPVGLNDFYSASEDHALIQLKSLVPGSQIYYTLDGSTPSDSSMRYQTSFDVSLQPDDNKELNAMVVTGRGRRSLAYRATLLRRSYRDAVNYAESRPGLSFTLFDGKFTSTREIEQGTVATTGIASSFDVQQFSRQMDYAVNFDGYLKVPTDGFYQFSLESDDGAVLRIDDEEVVNNDGNHPVQAAGGNIPLRKGFHKIKLAYFQAGGGASLQVQWAPSGQELKMLDDSALYH